MELTDRQNRLLSGLVGVLVAANGLVWVVFWDGLVGRATGGVLALGGGFMTLNAIRAIRGAPGVTPMDWTTRKTLFNVLVILLLFVGLLVSLRRYL